MRKIFSVVFLLLVSCSLVYAACDWINVRDYGAVGDGTTDDTAAFTSALYAARGKVLYVPRPSSCYLVDSLALSGESYKGTRIIGDNVGTPIKFTGTSYGISLSSVNFIGIENLKLWPTMNTTDLIYMNGANFCNLKNIHLGRAANDPDQSIIFAANGIHMESSSVSTSSTYNSFTNVRTRCLSGWGIYMNNTYATDSVINDNIFTRLILQGQKGIRIVGARGNFFYGMTMECTVTQFSIEDNASSIGSFHNYFDMMWTEVSGTPSCLFGNNSYPNTFCFGIGRSDLWPSAIPNNQVFLYTGKQWRFPSGMAMNFHTTPTFYTQNNALANQNYMNFNTENSLKARITSHGGFRLEGCNGAVLSFKMTAGGSDKYIKVIDYYDNERLAIHGNGDITIKGGVQVLSDASHPNTLYSNAPVGSIFLRTNGGAGSTFYVKEPAGWVAK